MAGARSGRPCDREGNYSLYDGDARAENYLRGVQEADADGWPEFTTIFPGCYPGRWPHVHFEVYESLAAAISASGTLRTSQLALLEDDCIDSDGYSLQMAKVTGPAAASRPSTCPAEGEGALTRRGPARREVIGCPRAACPALRIPGARRGPPRGGGAC